MDHPDVGGWLAHTIIAGWWPTTYRLVGTIEYLGATGTDGLLELTRSLPGANPRDEYIVQVFKCDRYGTPTPQDPYYERSYDTKEQALQAHREVVRLLCAGKLKLKRIRRFF
jgi:hypothetical protein